MTSQSAPVTTVVLTISLFSPRDGPAHHMDAGGSRFPVGHPMSHLMSLNNPLLSRSGMIPGLPAGLPGLPGLPSLHGGNAQALLDSYKQSYGDMIKHLHG